MGDYILKRVAWTAAVIIGVTMLTFFMLFVLPGDPAEMLAISRYGAQDATREAIESIKIQEGLDRPIFVQYGVWLGGVLTGDLGKSRISGKPVWDEITARLPATLQLAGASLLLSLGIGMSLGIIAAVRRNTLWDYLFTGSSLIGIAIPNFWLGLMLKESVLYMRTAPHLVIYPGLAIMISVLAFNFFGDGLRDYFDVKANQRPEC